MKRVTANMTNSKEFVSSAAELDNDYINYHNSDRKLHVTLGQFKKKACHDKGRPYKLLVQRKQD